MCSTRTRRHRSGDDRFQSVSWFGYLLLILFLLSPDFSLNVSDMSFNSNIVPLQSPPGGHSLVYFKLARVDSFLYISNNHSFSLSRFTCSAQVTQLASSVQVSWYRSAQIFRDIYSREIGELYEVLHIAIDSQTPDACWVGLSQRYRRHSCTSSVISPLIYTNFHLLDLTHTSFILRRCISRTPSLARAVLGLAKQISPGALIRIVHMRPPGSSDPA